ncbi:MAG: hypothetical protein PWP16_7 [Eubacteriaceae bacterium]|jgi:antitoxin component YwqK of YwqJK toxin-antitoxin module|nr:hypothetical protein [Eubacteriaceae bacterium]MDK2935638.1 hypothetical protein [Eubacteriaceae bacterium]MDN5306644.1 hypothetical protein [Eubacteriaceae bacterium]
MIGLMSVALIVAVIILFWVSYHSKEESNQETIFLKTRDGYIKGHMLDSGLIKGQAFSGKQLVADGYFLNGLQTGQGKMFFQNGRVRYDGHFEKGQPSGEGKLYEEDGRLKYLGNFINGYAAGRGKIFDDKGHLKIEGQFKRASGFEQFAKDPSLPYGHCREYYSNGKIKYDGEFENGLWHGQGKLYDSLGKLLFKGSFYQGKPN